MRYRLLPCESIATISGPSEGVSAAQRRVLPLVEVRAEFSLSRVELDDADRGATDIDLPELDEAVRQIAIGENVAVFHGYEAAGIRGITESTSHEPIVHGKDMEHYPNAVAMATDHPAPTSPRTWSSGTATWSKKISANPVSPSIWAMGRTVTPGESMATRK